MLSFGARRATAWPAIGCGPATRTVARLVVTAAVAVVAGCGDSGLDRRVGPAAGRGAAPGAPPNVVFVVLDTVRADHLSTHGYQRATTPLLADLARDGVNYRRAHAVAPWTLPSHMSMFTGLLPGQHGATWRAFNDPEEMSLEDILARPLAIAEPSLLLPVRLRRHGYTTWGFSNNAWVARRTGFDNGFDVFVEMWRDRQRLRRRYARLPRTIRSSRELDFGDAGLTLLRFRQEVVEQGGLPEPFFLFFNLIDPHFPYSAPPLWRYAFSDDQWLGERIASFDFDETRLVAGARPVDIARFAPFYDAELSYVDFVLGRLVSWLREQGLYDDSLIVVTSDHGEHLGERGKFSHQFSVDEELLHVPLVIKYPGQADAGTVNDNPLVSPLDVYATIAAAAGLRSETPTLARDLARFAEFDRTHLIAESDFSIPYLRLHAEANEAFAIESHRVVRRAVYTAGGKYAFVSRPGDSGPPTAQSSDLAADTADARSVAVVLEDYLQTLGGGIVAPGHGVVDDETIERLRSLGYVR